jgi:hypothetical protein
VPKTITQQESAVDHATLLHHAVATTAMSVQHVRLMATVMAHQRVAATTATTVQLVQHLVTVMIVQRVRLMETAMIVQHVLSAQTMVAVIGLHVETKARVARLKKLGTIAMIVQLVRLTETVMTVQHVQRLVTVMTVQRVRLMGTAMSVQRVVTQAASSQTVHHSVAALVIAIAQSVRHTASQIQQDLKTAMQNVETSLVIATQEAMTLRREIQTVQIVPLVMTLVNHHSAELAIQTQTKKLSLKTRFLSA